MKRAVPSFIEASVSDVVRGMRPRPTARVKLEQLLPDDTDMFSAGSSSPESTSLDDIGHGDGDKTDSTVNVYLRLRPISEKSSFRIDGNTLVTVGPGEQGQQGQQVGRRYTFSNIFADHASQVAVYEKCIRPAISMATSEQGATFLTYGTSGSGKTYTLLGTDENPGILPRAIAQVFEENAGNISQHPSLKIDCMKPMLLDDESVYSELKKLKQMRAHLQCEEFDGHQEMIEMIQSQHQFEKTHDPESRLFIWVTFVEIYNENVYDLLNVDDPFGKRKPLKIITNDGNAYIKDLSTMFVRNQQDALNILQYGLQSATYGATDVNRNSSRSHSIFSMTVVSYSLSTQNVHYSVFKFCDLAGTERLKKTGNMGNRLKEAQKINTSLLVLGRCLETVHKNQKSRKLADLVPVRDSKLTMFLQSALVGKERLTMVVNLFPTDEFYDENVHVLNFASIAREIVVQQVTKAPRSARSMRYSFFLAQATSDPSAKIDVNALAMENDRLQKQLEQLLHECEHKDDTIRTLRKELVLQELQLRNELTDGFESYIDKREDTFKERLQKEKEFAVLPYKMQIKTLEEKVRRLRQTIEDIDYDEDEYERKLEVYEEEIQQYRAKEKRGRRLSL